MVINAKACDSIAFARTSVFLLCLLTVAVQAPLNHKVSVFEAKQIAADLYIYGYSLITTNMTRVQMSSVPASEALQAPLNRYINAKRYLPAITAAFPRRTLTLCTPSLRLGGFRHRLQELSCGGCIRVARQSSSATAYSGYGLEREKLGNIKHLSEIW